MNIKATPVPGGWQRAVNAARLTQGKAPIDHDPSDKWKKQALVSEHSVIRLVEYDIVIEDVPSFVVVHLVRHFMGVVPFVSSSRPDITGQPVTRHEQRKDDPVTVQFSANAQALINMSDRRLCNKAEAETRKVWFGVKKAIALADPIMAEAMQPRCVLRNGFCGEQKPCGFCHSEKFFKARDEYHANTAWKEIELSRKL